MKIYTKENDLILEDMQDFNIREILECGQCFHFDRLQNNEYIVSARQKLLHIKQIEDYVIFYNTTEEDFKCLWESYFDLKTDYKKIKKALLKCDGKLKAAIEANDGIRILNQDFFETLLSFIISQNKQIPHIKQIVNIMSKNYGTYLGTLDDKDYYSFPTPYQMSVVTEEELRGCKAGFRAPYIIDAVHKVLSGEINEHILRDASYEDAVKQLMMIKGVGEKVANCVMLFSLGKRNAFPIDVWIKRIMESIYFEEGTKTAVIEAFARECFGEYGGYAQQYLFCYARENKMAEKNMKKEK